MPDSMSKKAPQDASRINMNEDWEVRYWTGKFGVSKEQLADTVKRVGVSASAVAKALGKS
ncbi:DUF3606 domain-containing protein [Microvirga pudoricolor]|uniref:DUF3606 domain-containing protein n=1 Tax=Microvirga pudoricolor TaxID=2778729 RepID=UPI00194F3BC3|nr:DUF3606 domain-containing protein [Microvirga pudoricolor]MBM6594979.1 DUF3606 domain-containing protein [Microvirga pudoricolor]